MSRSKTRRTVCELPRFIRFLPTGCERSAEGAIEMTVEEYEAVRLIDREGLTQEECANYMQVARTTVQQIYNEARKKISLMLVEGKPLLIKGGDYRLCDGTGRQCGCGGCRRHRNGRGTAGKFG